MICPKCNAKIKDDRLYCEKCGYAPGIPVTTCSKDICIVYPHEIVYIAIEGSKKDDSALKTCSKARGSGTFELSIKQKV